MKVDICILSKTESLLSKAIGSIRKHCDMGNISQVVVGWTGERMPGIEHFTGLVIQKQPVYNFAKCCNELVTKHCRSEAVLFMNDDVELVDDAIAPCLQFLKLSYAGAVGIKLLYPDKTIQHAGVFVKMEDGKFKGCGHYYWKQPDQKLPVFQADGVTGAFMLVKRVDFAKVGGFNEKYVHCFEDVELCLRLRELGRSCICNNLSWAWHAESQTRKQSFCKEDIERLSAAFEEAYEKRRLKLSHVQLAVCAIASPLEKKYIDEWLEWHRKIGVQRFYIATNNWTMHGILNDVIAVRADGRDMQRRWYTHFAREMSRDVDWCAFIDIDEFIKPDADTPLRQMLSESSMLDSLSLSWKLFGSNGLHYNGETSVLKRFTKCQRGFNEHTKQIINFKKLRSFGDDKALFFSNPHCALTTKSYGIGQWTVDGRQIHGPLDYGCNQLSESKAWIAHYFCKTPEEWKLKQQLGRADVPEGSQMLYRKDEEFALHDLNDEECTILKEIAERT